MRIRHILHGIGEILITIGLVLLLFVSYELWITDLFNHRTQQKLHTELQREWQAHAAPASIDKVPIGSGIAVLRIPRFGKKYNPVIVEGVGTDALQRGPGHFPTSALPGQVGNFVVSGHRTTYGKPFERLNEVKAGDKVVIETQDRWVTYVVTTTRIVSPSDVGVILPVPDQPGVRPTQRLFTFTTCNPKFSASQRLIVSGTMVSDTAKSKGLPAALTATQGAS